MNIRTLTLQPGAPEIVTCAKWRIEAFGDVLERSLEEEISSLQIFATDQAQQVALLATCDGVPAGTCLLAPKELEPCHHPVSPWLAGLYVAPAYRRRGVGRHLVRAIEAEASARGLRS